MSSLTYLESALHQAGSATLHGLTMDTQQLDQELMHLRRWIGERGSDRPPEDTVVVALRDFYRDQELRSRSQARLVCFGCLAPVLPAGQMLIEDGERFPALLTGVDAWLPKPRAFRLCYRGLLYAYFDYDAEKAPSSGRRNWEQLRIYLSDRAANTVTDGTLPGWVDSLQKNMQVLGDDPGGAYGRDLLAGDSAEFDRAREALDIREDSWLIWRLVLGQIEAAAGESDRGFEAHLPRLLELLERHPLAVNAGLARLLGRYRASTPPLVHAQLRDFAVAQWGNPWLSLNKAKWSQVSDDARAMVADWLKLVLIQQFFSLLAADGSNDTRRLKFWERYHDSIDDMYFALGSNARWHPGQDFKDIRKKMAGRLLNLHSAGSPDNNAFIMCIGNHVVVEFGLKGNACFIFRRDSLPFKLNGDIVGNGTELKHESHVERLLHHDSNFMTWERKFQSALASQIRARPSQPRADGPPATSVPPRGSSTYAGIRPAPASTAPKPSMGQFTSSPQPRSDPVFSAATAPFSERELSRLCDTRRIRMEDLRDRNGNLWALTDDGDPYVSGQLHGWGFSYKAGKGWWRK
jgi:hypothetical protein